MFVASKYTLRFPTLDPEQVPALHAARLVGLFLCAVFLNYGALALVLLALVVFRFRRPVRGAKAHHLIEETAVDVAAFFFGFLFTLSFHVFGSATNGTSVSIAGGWLLLVAVLLSTKLMILQHAFVAISDDVKKPKQKVLPPLLKVGFALLSLIFALTIALLLLTYSDSAQLWGVFVREMMPGIL